MMARAEGLNFTTPKGITVFFIQMYLEPKRTGEKKTKVSLIQVCNDSALLTMSFTNCTSKFLSTESVFHGNF